MKKSSVIASALTVFAVAGLTFGGLNPAVASVLRPHISALKTMDFVGKLYVPRYGKNYVRAIQESTTPAVLNGAGLGHYIGTQLPGEVGNFAIAGHRAANGGPMLKIDKLREGDLAFVKAKTGWYTYRWLATKVVKPSDVSVVYPVPKELPGAMDGGSYMTFTSCTPVHVNTYRIVAWFELVEGSPLEDGMPAKLVEAIS